jgi:FMN phosphatase YigB (HAD superfamily)
MIVVQNTNCVFFDCDDTLVMWDNKHKAEDLSNCVLVDDGFIQVQLVPHREHIQYLKSSKLLNKNTIVVWSAGGWQWAQAVVKALGLEEYVDAVMEKPIRYVDDLHCTKFMGDMIYKPFKG